MVWWWAHLGSNQGPTGYEPVALPAELWARQMHVALKYPPAKADLATVDLNRMLIQPEFVKEKPAQPDLLASVIIHKAFQYSAPAGMSQFSEGFGFYLPNTLSGYAEISSHFFQGMVRFSPMPNRIRSTFSSLGVRVVRTFRVCSAKPKLTTASPGERIFLSSIKSPR